MGSEGEGQNPHGIRRRGTEPTGDQRARDRTYRGPEGEGQNIYNFRVRGPAREILLRTGGLGVSSEEQRGTLEESTRPDQ